MIRFLDRTLYEQLWSQCIKGHHRGSLTIWNAQRFIRDVLEGIPFSTVVAIITIDIQWIHWAIIASDRVEEILFTGVWNRLKRVLNFNLPPQKGSRPQCVQICELTIKHELWQFILDNCFCLLPYFCAVNVIHPTASVINYAVHYIIFYNVL